MKVVAINGSPRKDGNTGIALQIMADELLKSSIETEVVYLGTEPVHGCRACGACFKSEDEHCIIKNDIQNEVTKKMREADGIILGSPTYFGGIAGSMKCLLDRAFYSSFVRTPFRNKVGTAFAVTRRAGGVDTYNQLNNYFTLAEMIIPPSQYWVVGYGSKKGEILQDAEGLQTIRRNAQSMAWVMKYLDSGNSYLPPLPEKKVHTNFIR